MNLGAAIAGGNGQRRDKDFYPTPDEATLALLHAWQFGNWVWEPACGDGAVARVLEARGITTESTDLVDRGYGVGGVDFLNEQVLRAPEIITNPPFRQAEAFIRHAWSLRPDTFAFLLKMTFWNAACRLPLFTDCPPAAVFPLSWRLDFTGGGSPTMDCAWVVWQPNKHWETTYFEPLPRPGVAA